MNTAEAIRQSLSEQTDDPTQPERCLGVPCGTMKTGDMVRLAGINQKFRIAKYSEREVILEPVGKGEIRGDVGFYPEDFIRHATLSNVPPRHAP